jgi:uncharacterized protein YjbI with pentapeptide repeats
MLPIWAIGAIAALVIAGTIIPGLRLWWPNHREQIARRDLGLALLTGAMIAFAVLLIQILVETRAHEDDQRRQRAAEQQQRDADRQSLQISVGASNLSGIGLAGDDLKNFYLGHKTLVEANLRKTHLENATLVHADLRRSDLTGAWLADADLSQADLRLAAVDGAHLERAQLTLANLDGATLEHAHLEDAVLVAATANADFKGASLQRAHLDDAQLANANLIDANLRGASLVGANLSHAFLYGADLSHTGSTIGSATLIDVHYDGSTRWPKWHAAPKKRCPKTCTLGVHPVVGTLPQAFLAKLLRNSPRGWRLVLTDYPGVTLLARHRDAEFSGEAVPWSVTAARCAHIYQILFRRHYKRFVRREEFDPLTLSRWPAIGTRYRFTEKSGKTWTALDVYASTGSACYRFRAAAAPQLFPLFRGDFASLLHVLHVRQNNRRAPSLYAWLRS